MTGRTHDLAAVTALTAALVYFPPSPVTLATAVTAIAANLLGAVAPDIDQPTSSLWLKIPAGSLFGHIISPLLDHHRKLSHSLLGLALFGFLAKYLLTYIHTFLLVDIRLVWWAFMLGFASHLVMDTLTKEGVPWFFPIPVRLGFPPLKALRVTTGGEVENLLVFTLLLLITAYLVYSHYLFLWTFFTHLQK